MHALPLSAKTDEALAASAAALAAALRGPHGQTPLDGIEFTLVTGRRHFDRRAVVIAASHAEAADLLDMLSRGEASPKLLMGPRTPTDHGPPSPTPNAGDGPAQNEPEPLRLARAWLHGEDLEWTREPLRRVHLPAYQFAKTPYLKVPAPPFQNAAGSWLENESNLDELRFASDTISEPSTVLDWSLLACAAAERLGFAREGFRLDDLQPRPGPAGVRRGPLRVALVPEGGDLRFEVYGTWETDRQSAETVLLTGRATPSAAAPSIELANWKSKPDRALSLAGGAVAVAGWASARDASGTLLSEFRARPQADPTRFLIEAIDLAVSAGATGHRPAINRGPRSPTPSIAFWGGAADRLWVFLHRRADQPDGVPRFDLEVCDAYGHLHCRCEGLSGSDAYIAAISGHDSGAQQTPPGREVAFHIPVWTSQAVPKATPRPISRALLIDAGADASFGERLAESARALGQAPALILSLRELVAEASASGHQASAGELLRLPEGSPFDCIYIADAGRPDRRVTAADALRAAALLPLVRGLQQADRIAPNAVWRLFSVDAAAERGLAHATGLSGLGYWLAQSQPDYGISSFDLGAAEAETLDADRLAGMLELGPLPRGEVIRLDDDQSHVRAFPRLRWDTSETLPGLRQGGAYLIVGGAGQVGQAITDHLIGKYRARVAWIGRRPQADASVAAALARHGANLVYAPADVTDPQATLRAVVAAKAALGPLSGAIFAAAQLETAPALHGAVAHATDTSARVKILGAKSLHDALGSERLDFLCHFSSIQSFPFTSAAETPGYAVGCAWSDAFAQCPSDGATPVATINWGYWARSIAGTLWEEGLRGRFGLLSDEEGCAAFEAFTGLIARHGLRQATVLKCDPSVIRGSAAVEPGVISFAPTRRSSVIQALWAATEADPGPQVSLASAKSSIVLDRREA